MNANVTETLTLDTPIARGDTKIESVTLRKPASGELRGVSLTALLQMDVDALTVVLPRISTPTLLKQDVTAMDPADLVQLGSTVAGFLLPKASRPEASPGA